MNKFQLFTKSALVLIISFLILLSQPLQAQVEIEPGLSKGKLKARAEHARKIGDLYTALFYYEEITKQDSSDIAAFYELGELHQLTRNYDLSSKAYQYVLSKAPTKYPFALYELANMQKMLGKYGEAKANFVLFKKEINNLGDKEIKIKLAKDIAGCDSGLVYQENPLNVKVANIGSSVNHPHVEFSPLATDSSNLLFGSLRIEKMKYYENESQAPRRQIYNASKVGGLWEETGKNEIFNDPNMDMGNFVYSPISDRYYYTKCKKEDGKVLCKLYFVERVNGLWQKETALPSSINLDDFTSTQPAIMYDTTNSKANTIEYLYYVSDRPDGKGGLDVWSTFYNKVKKEWSKPTNVVMMNTSENECTPFFHVPTQTFYFSSQGYASAGGYDVYKIVKTGTRYSSPKNMGFPVNSPQDDLDFKVASKSGKKGFLVSNRYGSTAYSHETCCDDIFSFDIQKQIPFSKKITLKIIKPDTTANHSDLLVTTFGRKKVDTIEVFTENYTFDFEPNQKYIFTLDTKGHGVSDSIIIDTKDKKLQTEITKTLSIKPKNVESPVISTPDLSTNQTQSLVPQVDLDSLKLAKEKHISDSLNTLATLNEEKNKQLELAKLKTIQDNIDSLKLVREKQTADSLNALTSLYAEKNKQLELAKLKSIQEKNDSLKTVKAKHTADSLSAIAALNAEKNKQLELLKLKEIQDKLDSLKLVREQKTADSLNAVALKQQTDAENDQKLEIITEVPTEGTAFVLKDVQYANGEFVLSSEAIKSIDSLLIPFLKLHPKDKLTVSSHTDNVGSHKFNYQLSHLRAKNVVLYLISKGINANRLKAVGFGETNPIAPNENLDGTPNLFGQSLNRRTEFLLIKN